MTKKPHDPDDPTQLDPTLFTKSEQRQLQHLMRRLGMTVWEVISMAREQVLSEIDPAPGEGERFEFHRPDFVTAEYFAASAVPKPDANVDLITALHIADRDTQNAALLLREPDKVPIDALFQLILNIYDWQRFLAVRDPDPIGRRRSTVIVAECERMLNRLYLRVDAALAKRKPYNPRDYFSDPEDLAKPVSSSLLGAEAHADAVRKHKAEINERRRALHDVKAAPAPQKLSRVKPKGKDTLQ
jgi:hypothetical protein